MLSETGTLITKQSVLTIDVANTEESYVCSGRIVLDAQGSSLGLLGTSSEWSEIHEQGKELKIPDPHTPLVKPPAQDDTFLGICKASDSDHLVEVFSFVQVISEWVFTRTCWGWGREWAQRLNRHHWFSWFRSCILWKNDLNILKLKSHWNSDQFINLSLIGFSVLRPLHWMRLWISCYNCPIIIIPIIITRRCRIQSSFLGYLRINYRVCKTIQKRR